MTIFEDSNIGSGDLGRMDVRLDVLFEQKQEVINIKGTKNDRTTTAEKAEGKYNAKAFLAVLFEEIDDWYWICRAIIDEMDRGKEISEKISVELHSFQEEDTIWLMMGAVEDDDFITL